MNSKINELIENIDQFVFWFRANPTIALPKSEKNRLVMLLNKIIASQEISEKEWEKLKPKERTNKVSASYISVKPAKKKSTKRPANRKIILPLKPAPKKTADDNVVIRNGKKYIVCSGCGSTVKDLRKHSKKCKPRHPKNKGKSTVDKGKSSSATPDSKSQTNKEYKAERLLDASRDYWKIRDQGRFGSHSSYDDMGDESFS